MNNVFFWAQVGGLAERARVYRWISHRSIIVQSFAILLDFVSSKRFNSPSSLVNVDISPDNDVRNV